MSSGATMSMRRRPGQGSSTLYSYFRRLDAEQREPIADVVGELDLVRRAGVVRLRRHHVEVRFGEPRGRRRLQSRSRAASAALVAARIADARLPGTLRGAGVGAIVCADSHVAAAIAPQTAKRVRPFFRCVIKVPS